MPKPLKLILAAVVALVALLAVALLLLVLLVDPNDFKPQLEAAAKQQTGRELRIDGELGWSFYPVIGIDVGRARLANAAGFGDEPMVAVERIAVGVDLLPLLTKRVQISQLRLEQPQVNLARDGSGRGNWEDILEHRQRQSEAAPPEQPEEAGTAGEAVALEVGAVELVDAAFSWRDQQQQQHFRVAPVNLETGAIRAGQPVMVTLSLALTSEEPALAATVGLTGNVAVDEGFQRIALSALKLNTEASGAALPANSLTLDLSGTGVVDLAAQRLHFEAGVLAFQLAQLNQQLDVEGELRFELEGDLARQRFHSDELALELTLDGSKLPGGSRTLMLTTPATVDLEAQTLALPTLIARGAGIDLRAQVEGATIVDQPRFSGAIDIAELPLRQLLTDLAIELPAMADENTLQRLALKSGFAVSAERVDLTGLQVSFDESRLTGSVGTTLGDVQQVGFDLRLDRIDADRYLPPAGEKGAEMPKGVSAQAPASEGGPAAQPPPANADDTFAFLDTLALDGRVAIGELRIQNLDLRDVTLTVKSAGRTLALDPLNLSLYGGQALVRMDIDARGAQPQTRVRSNLEKVAMGSLIDAWLEKRGPVEGTGNLQADLRFTGLDASAILASASGGGQLRLSDGAVRGVNVAQEIRNALATIRRQPKQEAALKTDFTELVVPFRLDGGKFNWSDLSASSPLLRIGSSGAFGLLDQAVDTRLDVTVVKSLKGQGGEALGDLAGLLVPVTLRGSLDEPKVSVDLVKVLEQTALGAKKEELEAELKAKAKLREDELKEKAGKELQRGLDRLFKAPKRDESE
jgi:AsmA protein